MYMYWNNKIIGIGLMSLFLTSFGINAQKSVVQSAANSWKYEELEDAKKFIDQAHDHPSTAVCSD